MKINFFILIFCSGIILFFFGMKLMTYSFKNIVSRTIKNKLDKITKNKFAAIMIGLISTAILQSSSATTLIVISLVHSNLLSVYNAIPIIMGANIGTTVTGQLLSFNVKKYTLFLYLLSFIFIIFLRKSRFKIIPKILLSLGLIFTGFEVMTSSILNMKNISFFSNIIMKIGEKKLIGVFSGIFITAIIQSSSMGIGILQTLATNNIISINTAVPILLGENIGTCLSSLLGCIVTNKSGKQAAMVHILFNIIGVVLFYFLTDMLAHIVFIISPKNPARQIANAHTIFNVLTTLFLLPFSNLIANLSKKIIGHYN